MEKQKFLLYAFPILLVLALVEALVYRRLTQRQFAWKESAASLGVAVGYRTSVVLSALLTGGIFVWFETVRPWHIEMNRWYHWFALFWGLEFCYYWFHRASHEVRWFWATHAVHHSPEHLNFSAAYRLGWTGHITGSYFFFVPLIVAGFDAKIVFAMLGANLLYQFWLHTELIPKLGWFEYFFNTPSHHRVHHATNPQYLDCNYGGVVIIFDRIFGTFVAEDEKDPCRFGLITQVKSHNPFKIAFHEWIKLFKDFAQVKKISHVFGFLFARPGWRPDGKGLTTKNLKEAYYAARPVGNDIRATSAVTA
ncbi:MAG: sterol desaturase family protein [Spirochaetes bacterium]|nr:sterol desaturase family protein [Spirochaetota bacterium]